MSDVDGVSSGSAEVSEVSGSSSEISSGDGGAASDGVSSQMESEGAVESTPEEADNPEVGDDSSMADSETGDDIDEDAVNEPEEAETPDYDPNAEASVESEETEPDEDLDPDSPDVGEEMDGTEETQNDVDDSDSESLEPEGTEETDEQPEGEETAGDVPESEGDKTETDESDEIGEDPEIQSEAEETEDNLDNSDDASLEQDETEGTEEQPDGDEATDDTPESEEDAIEDEESDKTGEDFEKQDGTEETEDNLDDSDNDSSEQDDVEGIDKHADGEEIADDTLESEGNEPDTDESDETVEDSASQDEDKELEDDPDDSDDASMEQDKAEETEGQPDGDETSEGTEESEEDAIEDEGDDETGGDPENQDETAELQPDRDDADNRSLGQDETEEMGKQAEGDANAEKADEAKDGSEKNALLDNVSYQQGQNDYGAQGTCGPTSIANSLNRLAGAPEYSENGVLHNAMDNGLCSRSDNPYEMGGTTTRDVVSIIDNVKNPEGGIHTEVYEYDNALSVDDLADRLDDPNTVAMVGVDSATLWDQRGDVANSGLFQHVDSPSDHWITVDSPVRDENGNVTGFNIIDSGGGVDFVDKDKFERMYQGDNNHRVSDPTAILVSNKGDGVNTYSQPEGVERASNYKGEGSAYKSDTSPPLTPEEIENQKIEKMTPAEVAEQWQGGELYPGIDKYENVQLHEGDKIYILESDYEVDNKCHSGYATSKEAVESSNFDARKLSEGLQIKPYLDEKSEVISDTASYRTQVTEYTVHGDLDVAYSKETTANPQYGNGGMPQYFVKNIEQEIEAGKLTRGESYPLTNSEISSSEYYRMVNDARTKHTGGMS